MSDEHVYSDLIAVLSFVAIVFALLACALGLEFCVNNHHHDEDLEPIPAKQNETEVERNKREAYNRAIENMKRFNNEARDL